MRIPVITLSLAALLASCRTSEPDPVDHLVERMPLDEKVGQMTQLALGALSKTNGTATTPHVLDDAKVAHAITERHVGSILNVADVAFDARHWADIHESIRRATAATRLGIPVVYGIDAVHGANYTRGATLFPHNLGMAATWCGSPLPKWNGSWDEDGTGCLSKLRMPIAEWCRVPARQFPAALAATAGRPWRR